MFEVQAGTGMNVFSMQMGTKEAMQEEEHGTNAPSGPPLCTSDPAGNCCLLVAPAIWHPSPVRC
jgi:hypothetical protein